MSVLQTQHDSGDAYVKPSDSVCAFTVLDGLQGYRSHRTSNSLEMYFGVTQSTM